MRRTNSCGLAGRSPRCRQPEVKPDVRKTKKNPANGSIIVKVERTSVRAQCEETPHDKAPNREKAGLGIGHWKVDGGVPKNREQASPICRAKVGKR